MMVLLLEFRVAKLHTGIHGLRQPRKGLEGFSHGAAGAGAVAKLLCSFASGVCFACFHAWIHGLYPVWSFATGKTLEVIAALWQLLSPAKTCAFKRFFTKNTAG
jgi:hypothetical protein